MHTGIDIVDASPPTAISLFCAVTGVNHLKYPTVPLVEILFICLKLHFIGCSNCVVIHSHHFPLATIMFSFFKIMATNSINLLPYAINVIFIFRPFI